VICRHYPPDIQTGFLLQAAMKAIDEKVRSATGAHWTTRWPSLLRERHPMDGSRCVDVKGTIVARYAPTRETLDLYHRKINGF
jgi:hypothetical protein